MTIGKYGLNEYMHTCKTGKKGEKRLRDIFIILGPLSYMNVPTFMIQKRKYIPDLLSMASRGLLLADSEASVALGQQEDQDQAQ